MSPTLRRTLIAVIWMIGGSSLMFALLFIMNEYIEKPDSTGNDVRSAFEVERPKPKKKPPKREKKVQKQKRRSRQAPRPAVPRLGAELAGLDFGLPAFDASSILSVNDSVLGNMENTIMTEDSVDTAPQPRKRGGVEYPKRARTEGITGYVTLNLLIDTNGSVERVKVLESEPPGVFDEAASRAVTNWEFDPATYEGRAVKLWARLTVRFDLQ